MTGVLEGIRAIDMGHVVAVPAAGATLADWGAEVIKIEPLDGELARGIGTRYRMVDEKVVPIDDSEVNWVFQYLNRNKRGLALNLRTDPGREVLYKLIQKTDIFMTNYEANTLKTLKADYETLFEFNPGLIYGLLTGYGTEGPDRDERGFDYSAGWARSGAMHMVGEPGSVPPPQRGGMIDMVTGAHVVSGVMAALLHKGKTGNGQKLEFSLYHTSVWTMAHDIHSALVGLPNPKHDRTKPPNPLFNSYRTKDDRWFWLAMLYPDDSWPDLCRAIGRPELEDDPRFNSLPARWENSEELVLIIDEILASKTRDEWEMIFRENNCIYGRVSTLEEVITDPQAMANNFFTDLRHPEIDMKVVTPPVKFCQNPSSVKAPAPEVGQHTEEILLELGYSWDDITQLKDQSVIIP
jgi:crotonobetainyl-CoA:carnitine CoA-transferase CaiB-like acyl-CoA transferase